MPLRCCGAEASHTAAEVFAHIQRGLDTAREEGDTERRHILLSPPVDKTESAGCSVLSGIDNIFKKQGSPGHLLANRSMILRRYFGEKRRSCAVNLRRTATFSGFDSESAATLLA